MRHPATQALYGYWNEIRGGRLAPRRLELQPSRMGGLLLDTFILERAEPNLFRFRLAGTRVASRFGMDLKSHDFLSCWSDGDRSLLEHHLLEIAERGRAGLFTGDARLFATGSRENGCAGMFELLVLPLVHTGHSIDRMLCHLVPLDDGPFPDGQIRQLRLLAAEALWPNGVPATEQDLEARQLPLGPHVRTARIVRHGRRQFRVYEGGREDATKPS